MMMFYYRGSSPFQMTGDSANDIRIDNVFFGASNGFDVVYQRYCNASIGCHGFDYSAFSRLSRP